MQLGKVSNVSFGYKLTPEFVESLRWCHGKGSVHSLLYNLKNAGNNDTIIHAKGHIFDKNDYDLMIFPKYKHKQRIYGGLRDIENLQSAEKEAMTEILQKAAKKGKLKTVRKSLIKDFPKLKKIIYEIARNPALKECNLSAPKKGNNLLARFLKYFKF